MGTADNRREVRRIGPVPDPVPALPLPETGFEAGNRAIYRSG